MKILFMVGILNFFLMITMFALLVSGCVHSDYSEVVLAGNTIAEINQEPKEVVTRKIKNKTIMMKKPDFSYGRNYFYYANRILFFDNGGSGYWWDAKGGGRASFSGSSGYEVVHFSWKMQVQKSRYEICIVFPEEYAMRSRYSISLSRGTFECRALGEFAKDIVEMAEGDIFNLASRRIPFLRTDAKMTFAEIEAKIKSDQ